ncbi:MAG: Uma2 family endonuclease [Capsulimonadales bacterium]|nr:Uma2 family endonuclease [Capsulimonadales bacterium]
MSIRPIVPASFPEEMPGPRRWTVEEFFRLARLGIFAPEERLELIQGEILRIMPTDPPHSATVELVRAAMVAAFAGTDVTFKSENPLVLSENDAPQPDVLVLRGSIREYARRHPGPEDVLLLIEVANSTLLTDRRNKSRLYADAGVPEYWIVNLRDRCVDVFRHPHSDGWETGLSFGESERIAPLSAPDRPLAVADLLP